VSTLASSRGPSGSIIAHQKPNSLPLLNIAQRNAEGTKSRNDYVKRSPVKIRPIISSSTTITPSPTTYTNYFASCDALLKSAGSSFQAKSAFPSSKSVSNISDIISEEKGCLTDVHCGTTDEVAYNESEDEVEVLSLLQEQIPKYKLRADSITKFGGEKCQIH